MNFSTIWAGCFLLLSLPAFAASPLATVSAPPSASASGLSAAPGLSGDGRRVVFLSSAKNLVSNDDLAPSVDVFVRDPATGQTTLISVNSSGTGGGNDDSAAPVISSDGRFVAFESLASNLVPNDTNQASDIFVRETGAGVTRLASVSSGGQLAGGDSRRPLISSDGRRVFFESTACNLTAEPKAAEAADIFVRDFQLGLTRLVSISAAGTAAQEWNSRAELCSITPDGTRAAFVSSRTNLTAGGTNLYGDVFVRDVEANTTFWASADVAGWLGGASRGYRCFGAVLSADGRSVVFKATTVGASLPEAVWLFRRDLAGGLTEVVSTNAYPFTWPAVSADGRYVAYDALVATQAVVWVWDAREQRSDPVSLSLGTGPSHSPVLSQNGAALAFLHAASDAASSNSSPAVRFQIFAGNRSATNDRLFQLQLVSASLDGQPSPAEHEFRRLVLSSDGSQLAFESTAETLVADDLNLAMDVFVRDLAGGTTQLVSQRQAERPARTSAAGAFTAAPDCLSADGRYLVVASPNNNLAALDTNWATQVVLHDLQTGTSVQMGPFTNNAGLPVMSANGRYVAYVRPPCQGGAGAPIGYSALSDLWRYDRLAHTTELINATYNGTPSVPQRAGGPLSISPDGRWIAFASGAPDLVQGVSGDTYSPHVYLRDMLIGTNQLISQSTAGVPGDAGSSIPVLSPDARWVMFTSTADNLGPWPHRYVWESNLYVRALWTNVTRMVSLNDARTGTLGYIPPAAFSADSRFIVFGTASNRIFVHDLANQTNALVAERAANPSISADGRLVVAETRGPSPTQIVLWDRTTGASNLISLNRAGTGGGNGPSTGPLITPNGCYVVFASKASDLVADDDNGVSDIFVRDRVHNTTLLVSRGPTGRPGRGSSLKPVLGAEGTTVVFSSFAADLVDADYNDARDVFVLRFAAADSDHDGLDDDWEMAYFGTLANDGTGDYDGDGLTDYAEFLAGTDPINDGSVLRVFILRSVSSPAVTLLWPATPGRTYRVQYKDDLATGPWTDLPGQPAYTQDTGAQQDTTVSAGTRRFYRVILQN